MNWIMMIVLVGGGQMVIFQNTANRYDTEQHCKDNLKTQVVEFLAHVKAGMIKLPFQGKFNYDAGCVELKPKNEQT